jgi:hypothetical protein
MQLGEVDCFLFGFSFEVNKRLATIFILPPFVVCGVHIYQHGQFGMK